MSDPHHELTKVASALLQSRWLPGDCIEDHQQKTYSAGRIAKDASAWREKNRQLACRIIDATRAIRQETP